MAGRGLAYALEGLGGLTQGLVKGDQNARAIQQQGLENMFKQQQIMQAQKAASLDQALKTTNAQEQGINYDPTSGSATIAPWKQAQNEHAQAVNTIGDQSASDKRATYAAVLAKSSRPDLVAALPDPSKTSAKEYDDLVNSGVIGKTLAEQNAVNVAKQKAEATASLTGLRADNMADRQALATHTKFVQGIQKNPVMAKRVGNLLNMDNAINNFNVTPTSETFNQLQTAMRMNSGGGAGGVGERGAAYYSSLGLKGGDLLQVLSGQPQDPNKWSPALVDTIKKELASEQGNVQKQLNGRLSTLSAGMGSFYNKHPEYKQDLHDLLTTYGNEFNGPQPGGNPSDVRAGGVAPPPAAPAMDPKLMAELQKRGLKK